MTSQAQIFAQLRQACPHPSERVVTGSARVIRTQQAPRRSPHQVLRSRRRAQPSDEEALPFDILLSSVREIARLVSVRT